MPYRKVAVKLPKEAWSLFVPSAIWGGRPTA